MTVIPKAAAPVFRLGLSADPTLERYGLQADGFLLAIGGVGPHKNLDRLLEGYGQSGVQTPLIITSSQEDAAPIGSLVDRRELDGRVRVIHEVSDEDLAALYGRCRAFVYPCVSEGFGLPVVEALACGAAVIACRTSSIPEIAGDAALLMDAARTRSFVSALKRIDGDPALREHLRRRAVVRAAAFSWARTAAATRRVYEQALEARAV
jgi:alpha-1,3-rhamnosyl/mannosyltransferase